MSIASTDRVPTIERPKPIVNDVFAAFDEITCSAERLRALFNSNTEDLHELHSTMSAGHHSNRAYDIWMIYVLALEKFGELEQTIHATQEAFIAVRTGKRTGPFK